MNKKFILMLFLSVTVCFSGEALGKELMVFPANGQGEEQMEKDKYECYSWAKKESGFDPMEIPKATEHPPQQQARGGGVVRGAPVVPLPGLLPAKLQATPAVKVPNTVQPEGRRSAA